LPVHCFRSREVEITAARWDGRNLSEILDFTGPGNLKIDRSGSVLLRNTEERAWIPIPPGHWVIKGVRGEFYPCSDAVLKAKYDPVGQL